MTTFQGKLTGEAVAKYVAESKLVKPNNLLVGTLTKDRYLVLLLTDTDRDGVARAISRRVWDLGLSLETYSPMEDVEVSIPFYKIWIDLVGIPIEL
jgi:hypothetical protein